MDLTTDALPSQNNSLKIASLNIDLEVLKNLEKELQDYERLSLLFLILEDYNCFEEIFSIYGENRENILSCSVGRIDNWQTKFFEALCVTKAKKIIRLLGKKFDELERIFVPKVMCTDPKILKGAKVHLGAKMLFQLFDQVLDEDQGAQLLKNIYQEINRPKELSDDYDLELHALYWMGSGFITLIQDGYGDLQNLLRHLKKLGLSDHLTYIDLESLTKNSKEKIKQIAGPRISEKPVIGEEENPALLNIIKNPRVIIFNVITVRNSRYEARDSSHVDVDKLKRTFGGLGYQNVDVFDDPTTGEIRRVFGDLRRSFDRRNNDGVIVCILSHGVRDHFVSHDDVEVPFTFIEASLCIPELQGLPKIVMVQACQGNNIARAFKSNPVANGLVADGPMQHDVGRHVVNTLNHEQFLLFSSTMKECKAIRHLKDGSWFIEAVCEVLQRPKTGEPHLSVHKWTQGVKNVVRSKEGEVEKGVIAAQLPEVTNDRFTHDFCFPIFGAIE